MLTTPALGKRRQGDHKCKARPGSGASAYLRPTPPQHVSILMLLVRQGKMR